ncbi:TetR/AcrR family transcriptional regulator [uncultured Rothia sp.]|uniref:TetR/AcrR family transcriptional regulator n=1 Tax=uncultured Rothia sp. TaxID=316088 RepID=UPI0025D9F910|nr:TetR/AcrR family transcriptional regulator [uncultured Rothia sp.]
MPRISAATNAAQRENTKRAILNSFGEILYTRGLSGLTMTDVAKNAGIGRTAVYNYFADMGELLVAYALDETERFLKELREGLEGIENPIDQLAVYIRLQINDLARRHLPPGPAMRSMLSPESYAKLGKHVQELQMVLANILSAAIAEKYIPQNDIRELAMLVHGSLSSSAGRTEDAPDEQARERQILNTIRFIQMGLGARFNAEGNPVRLDSEELVPQLALAQDESGRVGAA